METIKGYLYGTSPKDGLPIHDPRNPISFSASDVAEWHVSRSYGSATFFIGAKLKDERFVWVIRSHQTPEVEKELGAKARSIRTGEGRHTGSFSTIYFKFEKS